MKIDTRPSFTYEKMAKIPRMPKRPKMPRMPKTSSILALPTRRKVLTAGLIAALSLSGCGAGIGAYAGSGSGATTTTAVTSGDAIDTSLLEATPLDTSDMFTERDLAGTWDESEATTITLSDSGSTASGEGVSVDGATITITAEGTYVVSGTLSEGQIIVDADDSAKVQIVLSSASITSASSAALYVRSADKVFVTLASGTNNSLSTTGDYVAIDDNNIDAALFSKEDLTINGEGTLTVSSATGHGIVSKDDLKVCSGTLTVEASKQALSANDSVRIAGGVLALTSGGDAIHAENTEDTTKGYIYVADGVISVAATGDALEASSTTQIDGGSISGTCAKGVKADGDVVILGGTINLTGTDDTVHANGNVGIWGGTLTLSSGDDGVHADNQCGIAGGTITVSESYEGLEGLTVLILDGEIEVHATDDGINAAGGSDSGAEDAAAQEELGLPGYGGAGGTDAAEANIADGADTTEPDGADGADTGVMAGGPQGDGMQGGAMGGDMFAATEGTDLTISGGTLAIYAESGDGLDSNNTLNVTGGTVYVYGPENDGNSALDYDGTATITGGTLVAVGMSGMAQGFGTSSTQGTALVTLSSTVTGEVALKDASGNTILSFTTDKSFNSIVVSCADMQENGTYTLETGGESVEFTLDGYTYGGTGGMMAGTAQGISPNNRAFL